jgi:hypothetical protein
MFLEPNSLRKLMSALAGGPAAPNPPPAVQNPPPAVP